MASLDHYTLTELMSKGWSYPNNLMLNISQNKIGGGVYGNI